MSLDTGPLPHVPRGPGHTWEGVTGEAQLADDVAWDVRLDQVAFLGMALGRLQQVVEFLWTEFLGWDRGARLGLRGPPAAPASPTASPGTRAASQGER